MKDIVAELKKIKNLTPHKLLDFEAQVQLKKVNSLFFYGAAVVMRNIFIRY
jgi:hypothetical protein